MIVALMIGRAGSRGLPGKNTQKVLGGALCEYPLIACKKSKYIERIFVSTDCKIIKKISRKYKAILINRPKSLATNRALGEHVFEHGYFQIKKDLKLIKKKVELIVLLMANAATINAKIIDKGIEIFTKI